MMHSFLKAFVMGYMLLYFLNTGSVLAQDSPKVGVNLGLSLWANNCDIPSGAHDTGIHPSFGPNFSLTIGKFRIGSTFYFGKFELDPNDGLQFDAAGNVQFIDEEAQERGFTSTGDTKRIDFGLDLGYVFNRYAILSFGFIINRHEIDSQTWWFPQGSLGNVTRVPSQAAFDHNYTDTQYWIGQTFQGSIPVETISTKFSIFYSAGILVLAGQTGSGRVGTPPPSPCNGEILETSARVTYEDAANPCLLQDLGNRPFGENAGVTFNAGAGFQLFEKLGMYGGYNFKFFAEDETSLIDNSRFDGPFFGLNWTVQ